MQPHARAGRGYVCTPYLHDHRTIELKDEWSRSRNVRALYFVTATFSGDSKLYFPAIANHYMLASVDDCARAIGDTGSAGEKASFVLGVGEDIFERDAGSTMNFVSAYYTEYSDSLDDMREIARVVGRSSRVGRAAWGSIEYRCSLRPSLEFPFGRNIMIIEVCSPKGHQSVNTYCEKMRRDITRRGITMTGLMGLSILETWR